MKLDFSNSISGLDMSLVTSLEKNLGIMKFACFLSRLQGKQDKSLAVGFHKWISASKSKNVLIYQVVLKEMENRIASLKLKDNTFRAEAVIQQKKLKSKIAQMKAIFENLE